MNRNFLPLILIVALIFSTASYAQYYTFSVLNAGHNPNNLNSDDEQPYGSVSGTYPGYSEIMGPGSSGWSGAQTLPFTFNFNGQNFTTYEVASAGVVTFTEAPTVTPSEANEALPSTMIPDNSICAWGGFNLNGGNDAIMTKTFGEMPNRQQWIIWASASSSEAFSGTGWCYWGIVLEETTNNVYVVDMRNYSADGGNISATVGIQIDGSNALEVLGSPSTQSLNMGTGGSEFTSIDNTFYVFGQGTQPTTDLAIIDASLPKYVDATNGGEISGTVFNWGSDPVTSYDVTWTDGTNSFTETFSANINTGQTHDFTHGDPVTLASGSSATITVTVEINGDANTANNSVSDEVAGVLFWVDRNVVGEEATGTWCGWCPRGHVWMEYMADNYPDRWIGIAVHNSDPMENSDYDTWMATQVGGYPSGVINRALETDPSTFEAAYMEFEDDFGVAEIEVEAVMEVDRTVNVEISAEFAASTDADYRFAGVVIEDEVTGTGSDWAQVNYYSGGGSGNLSGAGHDWHDAPDPVPAEDMVYEDVGRELLGGIDGEAGSVPSPITAGDIVDHDFTHSLSTDYNEEHIRIAVLLIDQETGEIINAAQTHMSYKIEMNGSEVWIVDGDSSVAFNGDWVPIDEMTLWDGEWAPLGVTVVDGDMISVYPNPVVNQMNIDGVEGITNVTVFDMTGRMVLNVTTETNTVDVSDLQSGSYNIVIENNGLVANKRIQIVH